ncbi:MAG: cyclodeaminase/cyclohydrolase family protein [Actinobacteria bacterium]|nr:cyclodeaminase/cyclohydrolase family protein [Actinomycetota bacterium]
MGFIDTNLSEFTAVLASKAPVPGGGGASALVGAVGTALGTMVGNLTVGKEKFKDVEAEIYDLMAEAEGIRVELLRLVDADAEVFEPLSRAYGIPKDDPTRAETMENALKLACSVPMDIMRTISRAVEIHARLAVIGSALALSDVGVGVVFCKAAIQGASLNVFINTKFMLDREYAAQIEAEADTLIETYCSLADTVYADVVERLR